jgi:hypothetical protein
VIGTHGRGIWILDDRRRAPVLTPTELASEPRSRPWGRRTNHDAQRAGWYGAQEFFAPNPSFDAGINYYLRAAASGQATNRSQRHLRQQSSDAERTAAKGVNHAAWDLRPRYQHRRARSGGRRRTRRCGRRGGGAAAVAGEPRVRRRAAAM